MDCGLPGSSVHGISQARILQWVAFSVSIYTVYSVINSYYCGLLDFFFFNTLDNKPSWYYFTYFVFQKVPFWLLGTLSVGLGSLCYKPIMWVFVLFWAFPYFWHYKDTLGFCMFACVFSAPNPRISHFSKGPWYPLPTFFSFFWE